MAFFECMSGGSGKSASGTLTVSTSEQYSISCGFKPKYISVFVGTTMIIYNEDVSTTAFRWATSSQYSTNKDLASSTNAVIYSIDDDGFTMNKSSSANTVYWFAVG